MVVAGQRDHAAIRRGARRIGVLERIDGAIDAGPLAVPDAEHAIDLGAGKHADLLAAPHRRGRQVLVEAGREFDVMLLEKGFCAPQRVIVHAERRAAVARYEAGGVEALRAVAFALQHRQADQRLGTGEEYALRIQPVLVIQPNFHQRHYIRLPVALSADYLNRSNCEQNAPILLCVPSLNTWPQDISPATSRFLGLLPRPAFFETLEAKGRVQG